MAFKIMNMELAERIMSDIKIGDVVELRQDGIISHEKVISKTNFLLTVQGATNRLTLGVDFTRQYQEAASEMARIPQSMAGVEPAPKTRGRPAKRGPQAPAEQPAMQPPRHEFLPPGYTPSGQEKTLPTSEPPPVTGPMTYTGSIDAMGAVGDGYMTFALEAMDAALAQFREDMATVFQSIVESVPEPAPAAPQQPPRMTCADCTHVNFANDGCDYFRAKPPVKVICNAQAMCNAFTLETLEDEIPF